MTEQINPITAFAEAQANMGKAIKNQKNNFLNNSYADLSAIQDAVTQSFAAQGFIITQECGGDEIGQFVDTKITHVTGHVFNSKVYLEYKKNDMQSLGGAITYARRYGLASLTGVPVADDDGNTAVGEDAMLVKKKKREDGLRERADKLETMLPKANAQMLRKWENDAKFVIKELMSFDKDRADKLQIAWDEAKIEVEA